MKKLLALAFGTLLSTSSFGASNDRCQGEHVVPNNWFVTVNVNNEGTKQDILTALDLFATGGFDVADVFSFDAPERTFLISYNPGYYIDPERGLRVKEEVLGKLLAIPATLVECNARMYPM